MYYYWFNYEEFFSPLIPLLIGLLLYKKLQKPEKIILASLFVSIICFAIIIYLGHFLHKRNAYLYHLLAPFDLFIFLFYLYVGKFISKKNSTLIFVAFFIFCIANCFVGDTIFRYNGYTNGLLQLLILILCLKAILKIAFDNSNIVFYKQSVFWIINGFLAFAIISSLSSAFYRVSEVFNNFNIGTQLYAIKLVGNDVKHFLFIIAFLCKKNT